MAHTQKKENRKSLTTKNTVKEKTRYNNGTCPLSAVYEPAALCACTRRKWIMFSRYECAVCLVILKNIVYICEKFQRKMTWICVTIKNT